MAIKKLPVATRHSEMVCHFSEGLSEGVALSLAFDFCFF